MIGGDQLHKEAMQAIRILEKAKTARGKPITGVIPLKHRSNARVSQAMMAACLDCCYFHILNSCLHLALHT